MNEKLKKIGMNTYNACRSKNMNIQDLAKATGISASCLYKLKQGKMNLSIVNLLKICEVLHVDLKELLEG